ncbi:MAG: amidase domain-containing protein [Candidatus Scatovivens sp.]
MKEIKYDRQKAIDYAKTWAYKRNSKYYNFDSVGGDCTSFISQCIYSGCNIMNYSKYGWYYKNGYNKSASWSGVEYLYNFLINNKSVGPYAKRANINEIEKGDIVQLSFDGKTFSHSLIIVDTFYKNGLKKIYVATHTNDNYYKDLSTYTFKDIRFIKIEGARSY